MQKNNGNIKFPVVDILQAYCYRLSLSIAEGLHDMGDSLKVGVFAFFRTDGSVRLGPEGSP